MRNYKKLEKIVNEIEDLMKAGVTSESPEFVAWKAKTEIFLINVYGEKSYEHKKFDNIIFYLTVITGSTTKSDEVRACRSGLIEAGAILGTFLDIMKEAIEDETEETFPALDSVGGTGTFSKVFIVHGHDGKLKSDLARLIEKQNIEAIILSEQENRGATVIEKIEEYSNVDAAICLFTSDDLGKEKNDIDLNYRARQNVVFETGYFMAKLKRENVILLAESGVELPSDLQGVMYTNTDEWTFKVLRELRAIGYNIDMNKL